MEMHDYNKQGEVGVEEDVSENYDAAKRYNDVKDRVDMERMGKKQELKRNFRLLSIFSFMCVAMSCWVFVIR